MEKRDYLFFSENVLNSFKFLVDKFNFKLSRFDAYYVRYENEDIAVNVYHGRQSYELEVEFICLKNNFSFSNKIFFLDNIVKFDEIDKKIERIHAATTKELVKKGISQMAFLTEKYASPFLKGNRFYRHIMGIYFKIERKIWYK